MVIFSATPGFKLIKKRWHNLIILQLLELSVCVSGVLDLTVQGTTTSTALGEE